MKTDEIIEVVAKLLMAYGEGEFGPDFADGIILDAKEGHKGDCSKCEPHLVGAFTCCACMVETARDDAVQLIAALTAKGLVIVPVEPTEAMLNAAIDVDSYKLGDISPLGFRISPQMLFERCYRAMIAGEK